MSRPLDPGVLIYSGAAHQSRFVLAEDRVLAVLPTGIDPIAASVAYLYRLGWNALRRAKWARGQQIAIIGLGAIGLATVEIAHLFGCKVLAASDQPAARGIAEACGAQVIDKLEAESQARAVAAMPPLYDLVISTSNTWSDWQLALRLAAFNGIISVLGFPGRGQPRPDDNPLASQFFYDKQLTISAAGFGPEHAGTGAEDPALLAADISQILAWIRDGKLVPRRLISDVMRAQDLAAAYQRLQSRDRAAGTIVLDWRHAS
jgi:threonine dehydrogenase-like Zn-dependent dehydrogenase